MGWVYWRTLKNSGRVVGLERKGEKEYARFVKDVIDDEANEKGKWRRTQFDRMEGKERRMNETVLRREVG